ncbi:hypothetical protein C8A01DRAFT_38328 [Parachaetomium inaequale]|uniref:Uncharacterized protein n=1 Tax=Parachaetomium inaequale TaxID=2588326 RepID=A0AAN6PBA7_9PEZI|nr:hypothetical protein C8A01DRAFT_38328 [Parachaetomium inaequale]
MKATLFLIAITPLVSAWNLDLWASDGRKAHMHARGGDSNGCQNIEFSPVINVNKAKFSPATDWVKDPGTFELYVNKNCDKLSYRNDGGTYNMKARKIRSYKVY